MNSTGTIIKMNELGHVFFPIEIRKKVGLNAGDLVEIFVDDMNIVFKKYVPGCMLCGSIERITNFKGKRICQDCIKSL